MPSYMWALNHIALFSVFSFNSVLYDIELEMFKSIIDCVLQSVRMKLPVTFIWLKVGSCGGFL